jgi:hypothetical protein
MSTLSSKPTKTYRPVDFISVFVFLALILTLLAVPFTGSIYNALGTTLGSASSTHTDGATTASYSFSADQQYWSANCSHGWSSDSTCDNIVARSQSCSISTESAYCSEYNNYLKQFSN